MRTFLSLLGQGKLYSVPNTGCGQLFVTYHLYTVFVYRNCIGQTFALAEIKTSVAMILRK